MGISIRFAMRWVLFVGLMTNGLCSFPSISAQAAPPDTGFLLILDASGSMWGRVEGQPKITIAKQVANDLIQGLPDTIESGLMAYGHRKKGDCADIEVVGALGQDRTKLVGALQDLQARGKTPLAQSLQQGGALVAQREGESILVLVSDGLETCAGDPCREAETLRQQGLKLVVHVVGFDVSSAAATQLQCIAAKGGGRYFQADNVAQLKASLATIKTAVVDQKPLPPAPTPAPVSASASKSKRIRIAGPGTVTLDLAPWAKMPKFWTLLEAESGKEAARSDRERLRTKAGEYQIAWRQSEHGHRTALLSSVVQVKSGKTVKAPIDTGIRITTVKGVAPPRYWSLVDPANAEIVAYVSRSLDPQVVPAGTFELRWRQEEHGASEINLGRIDVKSGQLNDILVDHGLNLQPAEWLSRVNYYGLVDEDGQSVARWNFFAPQVISPGQYTLVLRPTEHDHNELIWGPVSIADHGFVDVPINSGALFLHEENARPPYRIIFLDLDHDRKYVAQQTWDPLPLPPGRYRLDWQESQHGSKLQTIADEVVVQPGLLLEIGM